MKQGGTADFVDSSLAEKISLPGHFLSTNFRARCATQSHSRKEFFMHINATPEQILPYAGKYRMYPLSAELLSDMRTPIEVLRALQSVSGHV